jgi:hypothetical protein
MAVNVGRVGSGSAGTPVKTYTLQSGETITPQIGRTAGLSSEQFTQAQREGILGIDPTPEFTWKGFAIAALQFAAVALPAVGSAVGSAILAALPAEVAAITSASTVGQTAMAATSGYLSGQSPAQIAQNIASSIVVSGAGQLGQQAGGALGASAARSAVGSTLAGADASTILRNTIAGVAGTGVSELTGSNTAGRLTGSQIARPGDTESLLQQGFAGVQQDIRDNNFSSAPEGGNPDKAALYSNEGYGGESATTTRPISFTSKPRPEPRQQQQRQQQPQQQQSRQQAQTQQPSGPSYSDIAGSYEQATSSTEADTQTDTQPSNTNTVDTGAIGSLTDGLSTSTSKIPGVSTTLGGSLSTARAPGDVSTDPSGGPQRGGWNEKSLRYLLGL